MQKILDVLRDEIRLIITVATIVASATWFIATMDAKMVSIDARLDKIQNNELKHIGANVENLLQRTSSLEAKVADLSHK